jgi:hypothetical protein
MKRSNIIIFITFTLLSLALIYRHEAWRDTAHAWLISCNSPGLKELILQMRYESAPGLWQILIYPFAKSGFPYSFVPLLNLIFVLAAVGVFLRFSCFSIPEKALFVFGYYIFFEYSLIPRNYILTVLFLFLIAAAYRERFKRPLLFGALIFLLMNSTIYGFIMAMAILAVYLYEMHLEKNFALSRKYLAAGLLVLCGIALFLLQLIPFSDISPTRLTINPELTLRHFYMPIMNTVRAYLPLSELKMNFWSSYPIFLWLPQYIIPLFVVIMVFSIGSLLKNRKIALAFLITYAVIITLDFFREFMAKRHLGMILIFYVYSLWIVRENSGRSDLRNGLLKKVFSKRNLDCFLIVILSVNFLAAVIAASYDFKHPFSAGKETAAYLKKNGWLNELTLIAAYPSFTAEAILAYIPKYKFFSLELNEFYSFIVCNKAYYRGRKLSAEDYARRLIAASKTGGYKNTLLILNRKRDPGIDPLNRLKLVASFEKTIIPEESFYIYKLISDNHSPK